MSKQGLFNYGQDIVMAFSPPVVGCLVKKGLQKWGHGHPRTPPWLRPCHCTKVLRCYTLLGEGGGAVSVSPALSGVLN